ncbi:hypothetical protein EJ076_34945 [Mesorhizobium sp. M7D.F.Ca.US.005.01.1.1]|uniref:hypothetical protein n=1 Tax=Mesorhizobium sp. M7D.F.Ca.US.005.01.1.1 TaxID=2493678 RepID=UPI000F7600A1|nr:hypothetical protein [Mesorhizobium sp. M7D.F.Ca.US.005.01.1.1]AZO45914.1 hypothetical protein EJ076_34945 [Mesorhizobium sp. M7D.F.Ca.US.005.01.1.1]
MSAKKDEYMRGYGDGFKDGTEAKGNEAHALAAKLAETEGMRDHYLSMWKEASAGQDAEERERVEILETFHKEVWVWLLKRGLVDNDDDEWRGFVDVIEEHEGEIEAGASRAAARIAEAAYEDAPNGSYDNGGTQDGWQMACQEIAKRIAGMK